MENTELREFETADNSYHIQLNEALTRLELNPDFKFVILDGYLKTKALGAVNLLAKHHIKKQGIRPDIMEELVAISSFKDYLSMIKILGENAQYERDIQEELAHE